MGVQEKPAARGIPEFRQTESCLSLKLWEFDLEWSKCRKLVPVLSKVGDSRFRLCRLSSGSVAV